MICFQTSPSPYTGLGGVRVPISSEPPRPRQGLTLEGEQGGQRGCSRELRAPDLGTDGVGRREVGSSGSARKRAEPGASGEAGPTVTDLGDRTGNEGLASLRGFTAPRTPHNVLS